MGWNGTTKRMTGAVGLGDISQAVGIGGPPYDLAYMILNGTIAKYAKWHPVRADALILSTDTAVRHAGRVNPDDYTLQYGVRAYGVGGTLALSDIHACKFDYERPRDNSTDKYRALDFTRPSVRATNGYNGNATTLDLGGKIWNDVVSIDTIAADSLQIDYTAFTSSEREERLSIKDFLDNESTSEIDPNTMYPCALISQGGYHFIHGLYTQTGSAVTTLGNASGYWRLTGSGMPTGTGTGMLHSGEPAIMSLFLVSQTTILSNKNIANWLTFDTASAEARTWTAWFCPIPDACGKTVYIGQAPSAGAVTPEGATYRPTTQTFMLEFSSQSSTAVSFSWVAILSKGSNTWQATGTGSAGGGFAGRIMVPLSDFGSFVGGLPAGSYQMQVTATESGTSIVNTFPIIVD